MPTEYETFLQGKRQSAELHGFAPVWMPGFLFDFQQALTEWAIRKGRAAIFADCGLGKTPMQLVWAENVCRKTDRPVLILTPLAVAEQTVREGEKFGIDARYSKAGKIQPRITVTNYERIHHFNPADWAGVVLDESSAIKAFDGKRRKHVIRFMAQTPYRLLCTATAAPNDWIELGVASEALGELTQSAMLERFFKSSDNARHRLFKDGDFWNRAKWFFRPHAEDTFWRWVCSWARAMRMPEDMGFDNGKFVLPELQIQQHVVRCPDPLSGYLFAMVARTLKEQREERKRTIDERCAMVAKLVDHDKPAVAWCQYNAEGDALTKMIPDAVQVAGCQSDDEKADKLNGFSQGAFRVLVTKPKIGAWGMNWQHCGHHTFFPSHSFEQYYQAIRRSLRFGRTEPVRVDIVTTEGEAGVTANLQKKQRNADIMFDRLVASMNRSLHVTQDDKHTKTMEVPKWL